MLFVRDNKPYIIFNHRAKGWNFKFI